MTARRVVTRRARLVVESVSDDLRTLLALREALPEDERDDWWHSWWTGEVSVTAAIEDARQRLWPDLGEPKGMGGDDDG